ncbi:methylenetetrahydrofolate reductase [NAD(P)H] [Anaerofustis stercorihominis]|uniref:Methylenetetrahydrofolate reductase n=1 Tax=Anaerofustis stercorihominis DSM 17244 TaxID=445971 RepID=B1C618_9FIRM|nr:methylenetetrahydrofolate reductase [NAD(P)H] [Anaerofustis stercorihominis]EDS73587.1 putative methylenetetrahydrofolate reductase (NAD(P)H) [Anaerofustis stercorihominis DSM 17244]MCQ4794612.1 methylenetetrahydrofolate reductase [NAD(P)H] [Anaerofustis stercorihominis]
MKITEILKHDKPTLSFEVFPPKNEVNYKDVEKATGEIAKLKPDFMSITYGAGGGTSSYTVNIAKEIQKEYAVPTLSHLTCMCSSKEDIKAQLKLLKDNDIENVLALRGDIPNDKSLMEKSEYTHAVELIRDIKESGDFCIGGACYPDGHVECEHKADDIYFLKEKVDAGLDFLTTQMFFDNNVLYNFLYRIREIGITVPVFAGIMPVTNGKQIKRITELSGTYLPTRFKAIVDKFGDDPAAMKQAGIAYATEQIIDLLANDVRGIHVYSMNKPEIAEGIKNNLSNIL